MKKCFNFIILLLVSISLTGCAFFHNPFSAFKKTEKNIIASTQQVKTNETIVKTNITQLENNSSQLQTNQNKIDEQKQGYVFGADFSLGLDPDPNQYNQTARVFTAQELSLYGNPTKEDINRLQTLVSNLLNTNQIIVANAQKQITSLHNQNEQLLNENSGLKTSNVTITATLNKAQQNLESSQSILDKAQAKAEKVNAQNAGWASKWNKLQRIGEGFLILIGIIFLAKIISVCVPPPYNSIGIIAALPFTLLFKIIHAFIPEAREAAGWVESEWRVATTDLVGAIQKLKEQNPSNHSQISQTIASAVSDKSVTVINQAKTTQGIVS